MDNLAVLVNDDISQFNIASLPTGQETKQYELIDNLDVRLGTRHLYCVLLCVFLVTTPPVQMWSQTVGTGILATFSILCFIKAPKLWAPPPLFIPLLAVSWSAILWSVDPVRAATEAATLMLVACCATAISRAIPLVSVIAVLRRLVVFVVSVSVALYFISPSLVVHTGAYSYGLLHGPFSHKNWFAFFCFIGLSATVFSPQTNRKSFLWRAGQFALLIVGLVLSSSATATLLVVILLGFRCFTAIGSRSTQAKWQFLGGITVAFGLLLPFTNRILSFILTALDRELTFSGRTRLWSIGIDLWTQRPWLGHGGGWLEIPNTQEILGLRYDFWWSTNFHNGFIQYLVEYGLVGLLAFALIIFVTFRNLRKYSPIRSSILANWLSILLLLLVLHMSVESIQRSLTLGMLFLVAACADRYRTNRVAIRKLTVGRQ